MFLHRNPNFAKRLGLPTKWKSSRADNYLEAIGLLARYEYVTNARIARHLGVTESAASRFLKEHQEVRAAMIAMNMMPNSPPD